MSSITFLVSDTKGRDTRYYIHHSKVNHFRNEVLEGLRVGKYTKVCEIIDGRLVELDYFNEVQNDL